MIGYEVIVTVQEPEVSYFPGLLARTRLPIGPANRLHLNWPQRCCCCGTQDNLGLFSLSHTEKSYFGPPNLITTVKWAIPCCKDCLRHRQGYRYVATAFLFGIVFFAVAIYGSVVAENASALEKGLMFLLPILAGGAMILFHHLHVTPYKKNTCVVNGLAIHYDGWKGQQHTFDFANQEYANEFASTNSAKINREIEFYDSLLSKDNLSVPLLSREIPGSD